MWMWALLDLVAPPACAGCGVTGSAWCLDCRAATRRVPALACGTCGGPNPQRECLTCADTDPAYAAARAYALYKPPFTRLLIRLKHHRDLGLGVLAAHLAFETLRTLDWNPDFAVPVPLGSSRLDFRGYNQVDLWGAPFSRLSGMAYLPGALKRIRETRSQVGLTAQERQGNLRSAFAADPDLVDGKRILVLDDVFTTGATANACAHALDEAGAAQVLILTLARAEGAPAQPEL